MSERTITGNTKGELERFEADIAAAAAEATAGKKNGKASEKLPPITTFDATESRVAAIVAAVTEQGTVPIRKSREQLDALEQELLASAQRVKQELLNHIDISKEVEKTAATVDEIVQGIRARHARVIGADKG